MTQKINDCIRKIVGLVFLGCATGCIFLGMLFPDMGVMFITFTFMFGVFTLITFPGKKQKIVSKDNVEKKTAKEDLTGFILQQSELDSIKEFRRQRICGHIEKRSLN